MADFVAVLKKTIDGLGDTTPATRRKVYDKVRATIAAKLAAISPPPAPAVVERQKRVLEDAIATVEAGYAAPAAAEDDPLAELENVFASLKSPQPRPAEPRTPPRPEPPRPEPKTERRPEPQPDKRQEPKVDTWTKPQQQSAQRPAPGVTAPPAPPTPRVEPAVGVASRDDDAPFTMRGDAPRPRRSHAALIAVGIVFAVIAGAGYGVWLNRDAFGSLFGGGSTEVAVTRPVVEQPAATPQQPAEQPVAAAEPVQNADQPSPAAATDGAPKFTQRLMPDGSEVDDGGGSGITGVGEGTSVAAVTQLPGSETPAAPPAADAAPQAPAAGAPQPPAPAPAQEQRQTVAVGQRAIFYEERTNAAEGSAELGNVVWSLVQESPGANQPAEPAIRAEATIPGKDLQLRMTIRRNADQSLPASHIVEMIFLTPEGFGGGGIDNILRVALKGSEQEAGNPLLGIPAKIADGFFLVALMDGKAEQEANLGLMRRQSWIDIPVVYKTGRRALITMEKGIPGEKVFQDAINAWQAATASAG